MKKIIIITALVLAVNLIAAQKKIIRNTDRFELIYSMTLPEIKGPARLWVPLASTDSHQHFEVFSVESPVPWHKTRDKIHQNEILVLNLTTDDSKKKITIQKSAFTYQKPAISIRNFSSLLSTSSKYLKVNNNFKTQKQDYFETLIKKNYTHYWNDFLNFQLNLILRFKNIFGNYENVIVFCVCLLNQAYNMRNANQRITVENTDKMHHNYTGAITQYTLENSKGLNPTTISELTGIPRASVIRKLNDLLKLQFVVRNEDNLFTTCSRKKGTAGFKKLSKFFVSNQPYIRGLIKDFFNYTLI